MSEQSPTPDLAVGICTQDNIRTIERTVRSVQGLAGRILVVDSGSTDGTAELCASLGAEVVHREWPGYARQKQFLLNQCADHRWVLLLDSDESLEEPLRRSIRQAVTEDDPACVGWELNRKVWFLGGWLHHTFQPEWRLRMVRGGAGRITALDAGGDDSAAQLHESIDVTGRVGRLAGDLRHDSWVDMSDMFRRYIGYGRLAAECGAGGGTLLNLLISPPATFIKQLLIKRGFLDGRRGLLAAAGAAAGTLIKHLFIAQRRAGLTGGGA